MKPIVLLIYADDLGYGESGCYGGKEVPTPNIDSIAAHGIRFTSGYVSAPLGSPSRAGLMTGRYQTRFGHENNTMTAERGLPLAETTLASRMKALGYATGMVGKWHLGAGADYLPMKRGFDDYFGVTGNPGSYFKPNGFLDSRVSPEPQRAPDGFCTTDAFGAYGDMKLVRGSIGAAQPELFDLAADLSEETDLLAQQPEQAKELQALWDQWNSELTSPSPPKEKHRGGKHRGERKGRKPRKAATTEV